MQMPAENVVNIAAHLPAMAERLPFQRAVVFPQTRDNNGRVAYTHLTFSQLHRSSNRLASGLEQYKVKRGVRVALMVKPSLEFFSLTFALFKIGAIPVFIDPGMGVKNLKKCLGEAQPEVFIGIPKAHVARLLLSWPTVKQLITVGRRYFWGGVTLDQVRDAGSEDYQITPTRADELAAILFTSGSTGVPKGAVYTHGTFSSQVHILKRIYQIQPGEVDLATFPLFALFAPALGMTAIIPDMDATRPALVDPVKIIEPIENFGVTNMFGSPALLNTVGRYGETHKVRLPSLKRVISAGAPVQPDIMKRFCLMLDKTCQIHTPYGATESLPVCTIGSDEILGETAAWTQRGKGVCVGEPVSDIELKIIRITDDPIETWSDQLIVKQGEVGEITVKGPMVTTHYFNRDASTKLAKIKDEDGQVRHRMGDLGYLDEKGRVWFCGRKAHRVMTHGKLLFTIPCEGVFNAHPKVYRTALVGVPSQGGLLRPIICVELEKGAKDVDENTIREELKKLGAAFDHTREIDSFLFHPGFPVDIRHNAKIFREKLAVWASTRI